jgi:glucosamine-phosphate N-acetyltransferase
MTLIFRPVRVDDQKVYLKLISQFERFPSRKLLPNEFENYLMLNKMRNAQIYVVIDEKDKLVATGKIVWETKLYNDFQSVAHIEDVVVDSSCRGKGVGRELVEHLVSVARLSNAYKISLNCDVDKAAFYERCGFVRKGVNMAQYVLRARL